MHRKKHTPIRLTIPFTMGMVGAILFITHLSATTLFILTSIALILTLIISRLHRAVPSPAFGIAAMTLSLLIGTTFYTAKHQRISQGIPQDTTLIQAILAELPQEKAKTWALDLQQDNGTRMLLYIGKGTHKDI
jgi:hypothetical protein